MSLNVGGGVRLIKSTNMCIQTTTLNEVMYLICFVNWDGGLIKQAQLEKKVDLKVYINTWVIPVCFNSGPV